MGPSRISNSPTDNPNKRLIVDTGVISDNVICPTYGLTRVFYRLFARVSHGLPRTPETIVNTSQRAMTTVISSRDYSGKSRCLFRYLFIYFIHLLFQLRSQESQDSRACPTWLSITAKSRSFPRWSNFIDCQNQKVFSSILSKVSKVSKNWTVKIIM